MPLTTTENAPSERTPLANARGYAPLARALATTNRVAIALPRAAGVPLNFDTLGTMKIRAATFLGAASSLLLIAGWLALPSRNTYGNPWFEELKQDCAFSNGTKARLYLGNGGATTAYWYSVTVKTGLFSPERQVAFSYSEPTLSELECRDDRLVISGGEKLVIAASEFANRRDAPLIYWRGKPEVAARTWSAMDSVRLSIAASLVGIAGWLGLVFRRNGNNPS